jgi:AraC family transcriptional regulator
MYQTEEHFKRILKVLVHIETNIDEEMDLKRLAKVACYSPFHFHRIFQAIVSETVHQYVKRLRLEKAAMKLRFTDKPVTEIALDACYDTPSAFTKAFKQLMGNSPQNYRILHPIMKKKIMELPMIQPDKIEKIEDLEVLFIRRKGNYDRSAWEAWPAMNQFIYENHLDKSRLRRFSIQHDDPQITEEEKIRFDACISLPNLKEKGEIGRQVIKGGKYAIFTHIGRYEKLEETYLNIYFNWATITREQLDETERSCFCEHLNMEALCSEPDKLISKIYIPLK